MIALLAAIKGGFDLALYFIKNKERLGHADQIKKALQAISDGDPNALNDALLELRADWGVKGQENHDA